MCPLQGRSVKLSGMHRRLARRTCYLWMGETPWESCVPRCLRDLHHHHIYSFPHTNFLSFPLHTFSSRPNQRLQSRCLTHHELVTIIRKNCTNALGALMAHPGLFTLVPYRPLHCRLLGHSTLLVLDQATHLHVLPIRLDFWSANFPN